MTFEESEISDWPPPPWSRKEIGEEEFSRETYGFTDEQLKETKSLYDPRTETIHNEVRVGICSVCRLTLYEKDAAQCYYGDQIHARCALFYNGRGICRMHVESHIGGKMDAIILAAISAGLDPMQLKKLSGLSTTMIKDAKSRVLRRNYIVTKGYGLSSRPKITPIGSESLYTMSDAFEKDPDFKLFMGKIRLITNVGTKEQS